MEKRYDVLEFYKIVNELIDLSRLENTKEKFLDIDIIKEKSTLDKELMLMEEMIDFYKYDDGFELAGLSDIQRFMRNVEVIGSYLSSEDLANLKRNLTIFRVSKSRAKNVRDKYKNIWQLFANIEEVKDIEQFIDDAVREDGTLKDDASLGLRDVRRQKQNINANIKEKFDDLMNLILSIWLSDGFALIAPSSYYSTKWSCCRKRKHNPFLFSSAEYPR